MSASVHDADAGASPPNAAKILAAPSVADGRVGRGCHYPTRAATSARGRQSPHAAQQNDALSSIDVPPPVARCSGRDRGSRSRCPSGRDLASTAVTGSAPARMVWSSPQLCRVCQPAHHVGLGELCLRQLGRRKQVCLVHRGQHAEELPPCLGVGSQLEPGLLRRSFPKTERRENGEPTRRS